MAAQEGSPRTPSDRAGHSGHTDRERVTALSFGGAPGVAVLGGDLTQLRLRSGRWEQGQLRNWRLRTKLTAVLLVPLVLAGVLGALRVTDSLRVADDLDAVAQQVAFAQQVGVAVHDLQRERQLAAEVLARGSGADRAELEAQVQRVDAGLRALGPVDSRAAGLGPAAAGSHRDALDKLSQLPQLRKAALTAAAETTVTAYNGMVEVLLDLSRTVLDDARDPVARNADAVEALTVAKEQISQQHAGLLVAILSNSLPVEQQSILRTTESRFDAAVEEFNDVATAPQQQRYRDTVVSGDIDRERLLLAALGQALQARPLEIDPAEWNAAAVATADRMRQVELALLDELHTQTTTLGGEAWNVAIRDAAVVAALLLLAVLLLVVVTRSLLEPLRTLRTTAFDIADRRLPEAVEKLRLTAGQIEEMVVDPVPVYSHEEVGQVARAFDTVHVQAVRLAAEQAILRSAVNDIFLNLAGRSQRLVERQLTLIDKLESSEQDPEQLGNLFQLDHLATRMRRNSENLLVLAGAELRRGTGQGTAVLALLQAAISEIAEYGRVTLRRPPAATVAGPAAGDLAHLIAELLDNATSAGPPDTPVTLSSALTEDGGLLVEITDSGTGLPPGELRAINERLASSPVIDVSVSGQMGLFVVSRLAARHRIRVRLRQARGEFGITATVLLPASLVSTDVHASTGAQELTELAGDASADSQWSGKDVELPLQVSVVEGQSPDPSSVDGLAAARLSRPRTTEQEWLELFGRDKPEPEPVRPPESPAPPDLVPVPVAAAPAAPAPDQPRPGSGALPQVHEEIFEEVSAWFRKRRAAPVGASAQGGRVDDEMITTMPNGSTSQYAPAQPPAAAPEWRSAGDEGWQAANALRTPVDFGVTAAGLPRRQPRAHLVPGAAGPSRAAAQAWSAPARGPDDVRGRLSSYQRGLQRGRHAQLGSDELPARSYTPQRDSQEGQQ